MSDKVKDRDQMAYLALFDHGSRDGATAKSIRDAMVAEGFTLEEIAKAAKKMAGWRK